MSRFVLLFSLLLFNIISSQYDIDCDAVHCTFNVLNEPETAIFVCTENADSLCIIYDYIINQYNYIITPYNIINIIDAQLIVMVVVIIVRMVLYIQMLNQQ